MKNAYIKRKKVEKYDVVSVHHNGVAKQLLDDMAKKKYSTKSIESYHFQIKHFYRFLESENIAELQDVTTKNLEQYQRSLFEKPYSPWTIRGYLRTLRVLFNFLEKERIVFDNPVCRLVPPKLPKPLPEAATEEDVEQLIATVKIDTPAGVCTRAMIETAYSCALRLEELLNIDMGSIDFKEHLVRVTGKGRRERTLPIGKQAVYWIKQYLLSSRYKLLKGNINERALWISLRHKRMTTQAFQKKMQSLSEESGLENNITPHGLRRACATHMLRNGAHPVAIQHLLGHSSLSALGHYLRLTINDLTKTHEKSKLGK